MNKNLHIAKCEVELLHEVLGFLRLGPSDQSEIPLRADPSTALQAQFLPSPWALGVSYTEIPCMKTLLTLGVAALLTVSSTGCKRFCLRNNDCAPVTSCDPCATQGGYVGPSEVTGDTYLSPPPVISPGQQIITPGPVTTQ